MKSLLLIGILAVFGCSRKVGESEKKPMTTKTLILLAAGADLKKGEQLDASRVVFRRVPATLDLDSVLRKEDLSRLAKRPLNRPVARGELLLSGFFDPVTPRLDTRVRPAGRSYQITVSGEGLARRLPRGSHVDVIAVYTAGGEDTTRETIATTLIENSLVLDAVEGCTGGSGCRTTLYLLVLPEEAEKLALAQTVGQVRVILRNAQDRSLIQVPRTIAPRDLVRPETAKVFRARNRAAVIDKIKILKKAPTADMATKPMKANITVR